MTKTGYTEASVRGRVREMVGEFAPQPIPAASPEDRLEDDLGYNSLELAELATALLDEFEIEVGDPDVLMAVESVADVEELLLQQLSQSHSI